MTRRRRILIAEDNEDAGLSLQMLLEAMGNEVHLVGDGESAVRRALALRPEVVILDIGLPLLSGYDATQLIRDFRSKEKMVIVILSGWARPEDVALSVAAGADFHLAKPLVLSELTKILDASPKRVS